MHVVPCSTQELDHSGSNASRVPDCNTPMWRDCYMLSFVLSWGPQRNVHIDIKHAFRAILHLIQTLTGNFACNTSPIFHLIIDLSKRITGIPFYRNSHPQNVFFDRSKLR